MRAISKSKRNLKLLQANLGEESSVRELIKTIDSSYGVPTKIVHLAAPKFQLIKSRELSWETIQAEINVQLRSFFYITNFFIPKMVKQKYGKIVLVLSSVTINVPPKYLAHYTISKYALLGYMKSVVSEVAEKRININAVSPSMIETNFLSNLNPKIIEINADQNPTKRNARVEDIVPLIVFLLSDSAEYINGVNIPVAGGGMF